MSQIVTLAHRRLPLQLQGARSLRAVHCGVLCVRRGRVWLTVDGEAQDRVLAGGECLALQAGHRAVIEAWQAGEPAELVWVVQATTAGSRPARKTGWPLLAAYMRAASRVPWSIARLASSSAASSAPPMR